MYRSVDLDAWSDGQLGSKLWLCRTLEEVVARADLHRRPLRSGQADPAVWILGGWYGVLGHLILCRERLRVSCVRSFDVDPRCAGIADLINNHWEFQEWRFKAVTADVTTLDYFSEEFGPKPDIVINCAAEHMDPAEWYGRIPEDILLVVQSTNAVNDHHVYRQESLEAHTAAFPMRQTAFAGACAFQYPDWSFSRWMSIGYR